ncbi:hypothetical protein K505DRAFT_257718 [Melanomma pulvis-pyrius CBS 109.77]|uniref:Histone chaperone domain-containing protein n=1 Tax=Melanomma pulvis-pyrius CBS 109.77 TaxID=1314802 RepID=A0A6A6WU22_9PLEO|nr:hypothetical protein K505DRAFT_257718 [Melanomma pulvis-pyrius CBS 109.77]
MSASIDNQYKQTNEFSNDGPAEDAVDNDYASRTGQSHIAVQKDEAPVEDPIDPRTADSDETLARDDEDAIDSSNILDSRTRGATKQAGSYTEPGDDEGLPSADDGGSAVSQ